MRRIITIATAACAVFVLVAGLFGLRSASSADRLPGAFGFTPLVVLSGSMVPELPVGSVVLVRDVDSNDVSTGDVVTFRTPSEGSGTRATYTTHRVVAVHRDGSGLWFETKGDANATPDGWSVPAPTVVGRMAAMVPLAGYVSVFVRSPLGFALLVAVPAALLIGLEALDLLGMSRRETPASDQAASEPGGEA